MPWVKSISDYVESVQYNDTGTFISYALLFLTSQGKSHGKVCNVKTQCFTPPALVLRLFYGQYVPYL